MPEWGLVRHFGGRLWNWFLTVYVLGGVPIAFHWAAVKIARQTAHELATAVVSDTYLYAFILSMAAVVDTVTDRGKANHDNVLVSSMIIALIAAVGYTTGLIPYVTDGPFYYWLRWGSPFLLGTAILVYAFYKIPILWGRAEIAWRDEKKAKQQRAEAV